MSVLTIKDEYDELQEEKTKLGVPKKIYTLDNRRSTAVSCGKGITTYYPWESNGECGFKKVLQVLTLINSLAADNYPSLAEVRNSVRTNNHAFVKAYSVPHGLYYSGNHRFTAISPQTPGRVNNSQSSWKQVTINGNA